CVPLSLGRGVRRLLQFDKSYTGEGFHPIFSNPVHGTNTFGILIPSGVWLFSKIAATIRGSANALPLSVCKTQLLHTLNGSALALPRIVAAILENNQTPEGINIPKVLVPWTGFEKIG
ncbi:MAG: hypothetical protein ACKO96_03880, partial [Flammeovirgaceae bacterium]